jgi:RHS repeat-associated protein
VVCPSSTLCVAVDASGYSTTYNGTSWATPTDIDGSTALKNLSCPSATLCVTSDASGNVLTFNGTSWSDPTNVDPSHTTSAISCPTTTFCVVSDTTGYATLWAPPAANPVSQLTWDTDDSLGLMLSDGTYDYLYGPGMTPVEGINLSSGTPTFMTYTPADSTWLITNAAGDETAFYGYDAFGNLAFGTPTTAFGYAGQYLDSASGFSNMRARSYDAQDGSFTTRDPAFSSTDTAYTYAGGDPVNEADPSGLYDYRLTESIGPVAGGDDHVGNPMQVMLAFQEYFKTVFPFPITGCDALYDGAQCDLHALNLYGTPAVYLPCSTPLLAGCGGVEVEDVTTTSFEFVVDRNGYFDAPQATITFSTSEINCEVYLTQHGDAPKTNGLDADLHVLVAKELAWPAEARNLTALMWELNYEEPGDPGWASQNPPEQGAPSPGFPTTPPAPGA